MAQSERQRLVTNEAGRSRHTPCNLTWKNLNYTVTPKGRKSTPKQILFDISGEAKAGEILAIMGSTGAGKSTLLDCLAGRKSTGALTGELLVNGASRPDTVGRVTAYVLQDDQVLGLLTVRETLLFSAQLRLGAHEYTEDERVAKVDELIEALGLENVQDSLVGTTFRRGISGGEKKRLCVAVELVTDPSILFCDEPTTGLDAFNSFVVMDRLKRIAVTQKRTVVCSIHQPRSTIWQAFDNVLLLSGGHAVYWGPASATVEYFSRVGYKCGRFLNPADFVIDVIVKMERGDFADGSAHAHDDDHKSFLKSISGRNQTGEDDDDDDDDEEEGRDEGMETGASVRARKVSTASLPTTTVCSISELVAFGRMNSPYQPLRGAKRSLTSTTNGDNVLVHRTTGDSDLAGTHGHVAFTYASGWCRQLRLVTARDFKVLRRNPFATYVALFQQLFMGVLLGLTYLHIGNSQTSIQNRVGLLFFVVINQGFSQFGSLTTFLENREIFTRERGAAYYRTSVFFIAKSVTETPMLFVFPIFFALVVYFMVGLQPGALPFFLFYLALAAVGNVVASIFIAVGSVAPNIRVAQIISPIILVLFVLYSGFYANQDTLPVYFKWISFISPFRYAYEVLMKSQFDGLEFVCPTNSTSTCFHTGEQVLEFYGFADVNPLVNFMILIGMFVALRILAFILLTFCQREKR